ncbi:LamG-like jellyroll fold domain-containing protein [Pseudozobellia thermophila]|uniref:Concanavalin A-like lectin/glucanases superfamily protein n=1 Tax=Pseudozobellia thermophila TaxID=192903 RepID=A0A1M6FV14_9FLAO|nr:LamG-like jellyroll fold domain-containing protein [Pseudozobellia thermophila]SHJ01535.1 Concanavalin A-like lectin/glucanases superfamily protein [Pseudozobellia thermophila]
MKNTYLKYIGMLVVGILFFNCQDLDRPEFSDFLYDGPVITLSSPSPEGSTIISSVEEVAPITISFQVEDDLGIANITVDLDGQEILNINEFSDNKLFNIDDLTQDVSTGSHTLTITATDIDDVVVTETTTFEKIEVPPYTPMFDGEMFYMAFDGNYSEAISGSDATAVGSPGFDTGVVGQAYKGGADSHLTFPSAGLLGNEFSATFWLKIDASDTRAGIINIAPADPSSPSDKPSGFGLIREGSETSQKFILLVGNGTNATWINPGDPATIDPTEDQWVHFGISISETNAALYMNGELVGESDFPGIDWTGVEDLVIMSGDPNFSGWSHKTEKGQIDELRIFNKALTKNEIQAVVLKDQAVFSMDFNTGYQDGVSGNDATAVGAPGFDTGVVGQAYKGAADSYLTFPSAGLLGNEFSATFWLKIDASDTRAGIINIAPADPSSPSDKPSGFGLIREGSETSQKFILLVGNGTNATWINPGDPATIDPTEDQWVHFGISISETNAALYMNGALVGESDFPGIDWTGVGDLVIMSGNPNFSGWSHKTEKGQMDELYIYNKALTPEEIQALMD